METRALAIALFYAVGTGIGGTTGPVLFGSLIATKRLFDLAVGYVIGGGLMVAAGIVEVLLGVNAEQQPLEALAAPLSAAEEDGDGQAAREALPASLSRQVGPWPVPPRRLGRSAWAPLPQASDFPRANPFLAAETDRIVDALINESPQSLAQLSARLGARYWGPGRLREAVRSGVASGRIRRVGRARYAAASSGATQPSVPDDPSAASDRR